MQKSLFFSVLLGFVNVIPRTFVLANLHFFFDIRVDSLKNLNFHSTFSRYGRIEASFNLSP